jgi:hypothetical protein
MPIGDNKNGPNFQADLQISFPEWRISARFNAYTPR